MRGVIYVFVLSLVMMAGGHLLALEPNAPGTAFAQERAVPDAEIDVNIGTSRETSTTRWFADPVWIAIGIGALVLVVMVIALASRGGGGTTIVK